MIVPPYLGLHVGSEAYTVMIKVGLADASCDSGLQDISQSSQYCDVYQ